MNSEHLKSKRKDYGATKGIKPAEDRLAQIENLDLEEGLHHAADNRKLYERLLKAFIANNRHIVSDMRMALSNRNMAAAQRNAHSLKGLAATIGARKLHQAAKAAERAIVGNQPDVIQEKLYILEGILAPLTQQIHLALVPETYNEAQ